MKTIVAAACTVLLLIAGALPGFAQSRNGARGKKPVPPAQSISHFYLVPTAGGYSFNSGDDFESGPLYGVRFGYQFEGKNLVDSIGVEGFGAFIDSRSRQDETAATGYLFRIDAAYNLVKGRFVPFFSLGAGVLSLHGNTDSESRVVVAPGLGVKYALTNHLDLRLDARRVIPFDPEDDLNWEYTAGLNYLFGKARTITPPRPPDADGDGVPDTLDKCAGTPRGVKVDRFGCPPDTDGDGVPDHLDQCPDSPRGTKVDASGCPPDSDGDGVRDTEDKCPGTPPGIVVDEHGCVPQKDSSLFLTTPPPTGPMPTGPPAAIGQAPPIGAPTPEGSSADRQPGTLPPERAASRAEARPATIPEQRLKTTSEQLVETKSEPGMAVTPAPGMPVAGALGTAVTLAPAAPATAAPGTAVTPAPAAPATAAPGVAGKPEARAATTPPTARPGDMGRSAQTAAGAETAPLPEGEALPVPAPREAGALPQTPVGRPSPGSQAPPVAAGEGQPRLLVLTIEFEFDTTAIRPEYRDRLAAAAEILRRHSMPIICEGHTDSIGSAAYNLKLSLKRAQSVKAYLVGRGIAADRIEVIAYGEDRPVADNATPAGRRQNRRAVILQVGGE